MRIRWLCAFLLFAAGTAATAADAAAQPAPGPNQQANQQAEALYTQRCAMCHDAGVARATNREGLSRLTPDSVRQPLTSGNMSTQAAGLTPAPIDALGRLRGRSAPASAAAGNACPAGSGSFTDPLNRPRWNGWGVTPAQHRFQPAAMAQLTANDVSRLKLKWAFGFPGVNRAFS